MVSGSKGEVLYSKVDLRARYGKSVMENSVMCTKCGICAKIKRANSTLAKGFVCELRVKTIKNFLTRSSL